MNNDSGVQNLDPRGGEIPGQRIARGGELSLVVPRIDSQARTAISIDPGSAIVACRMANDPSMLLVYFEGNRFGAENLQTLHDRAVVAYGRMVDRASTIAMSGVEADRFEVVGRVSDSMFELDKSHPALIAWTAHDPKLLESPIQPWRSPRR